MYRILIGKKAGRFLSRLEAKSYNIISSAIIKLADFRNAKNLDIQQLKGRYAGMWRLRVGSRRVLFTVEERKEIKIWIIEDRGDVYK